MKQFAYFSGVIIAINNFWVGNKQIEGCYKIISLEDTNENIVNFIVTPDTYFVENEMMIEGLRVIGFYDANAPVPLIFPPQYRAIVMARCSSFQSVKVDHFDSQLISSDGTLKLNISPFTLIITENGQPYVGSLTNHNLIVVYGATTRSIPAQTTPYKIIVMCRTF